MNELMKKQKGITLIALVVTIIVLLILAGVSIAMLTGQTGILKNAQAAREKTAHSEVYEALNFEAGKHLIEKNTEEHPEGYPESVIEYFKEKEYIYTMEDIEGYIVDVEKLLGEKTEYGNGTDGKTDVYKLEEVTKSGEIGKVATTKPIKIAATETEKIYKLMYYGKNATEEAEIGRIRDTQQSGEPQKQFGEPFTFKIIKIQHTSIGDEEEVCNCTALTNMTWGDWISSEYNTIGMRIEADYVSWGDGFEKTGSGNQGDSGYNGAPLASDLIVQDESYYFGLVIECVYPNSSILISKEGITVQAKDIKERNDIAYYNFETKEMEIGKVEEVYIHKKATEFVKYEFEDGSYIEVTDYHPIYTKGGWRSYTRRNGYEVPEVGDEVKTETGWKKLTKIESFEGEEDCYDFKVKGENGKTVDNYFANGTLVQGSY